MDTTSHLLNEDVQIVEAISPQEAPRGQITKYWLHLVTDGMGVPVHVPVIIAKGEQDGAVLGITAAVHGNELNGISVIQRLFRDMDVRELRGTIIGVPVVNIPSLLRNERSFIDGADLNQIMPGKADGNVSQVYAHRIVTRIVQYFDYLVDLHTGSFGRLNSYYVRADMDDDKTRQMALLQNAQIIVHNPPLDGTLRGAAASLGIHAITLEVGNPNTFQKRLIRSGVEGIHNLLVELDMYDDEIEPPADEPIICKRSRWLYTDTGGILTVLPNVTDYVKQGDRIAIIRNIFGETMREYFTPEEGIVIGKSVDPINQTGGRILHLGVV